MTANIALNAEQFRTLVEGGVVTESAQIGERVTLVVRIILSDIGFAVMRKAIDDADFGKGRVLTPEPRSGIDTMACGRLCKTSDI